MQTSSIVPTAEAWGRYWPQIIVTIIAIIQLILSLIAVGLHSGIVYIEIAIFCASASSKHVMGYICWLFFTASWIATCCITCCNRSSICCATYALAQNVAAFIFSAVLIDYCRKFLVDEFDIGSSSSSSYCSYSSTTNYISQLNTLTSLDKSLLAIAVLILLSTLAFAGIYIYTFIRVCLSNRTNTNSRLYAEPMAPRFPPNPRPFNDVYQQNPAVYMNQPVLCAKCRQSAF
ncbi:unnamed protein product [Rotaria socialis]|uniref:Uncharacterized protein n=1 Tax=Rotaria socialis TaxID=392032 RepID=A0A821CDW3_9BILA|nr:unnamed protein product [Rotaria socialis]CAF4600941.1 unnamed protein product [Rotaria socialis]